jgi:hypothetical protein
MVLTVKLLGFRVAVLTLKREARVDVECPLTFGFKVVFFVFLFFGNLVTLEEFCLKELVLLFLFFGDTRVETFELWVVELKILDAGVEISVTFGRKVVVNCIFIGDTVVEEKLFSFTVVLPFNCEDGVVVDEFDLSVLDPLLSETLVPEL